MVIITIQDIEHSVELSHSAIKHGACAAITINDDDGQE
ncbi:Uncharacterised protein [Legionella busanensis]|uniref:Uncharacterized protein n=1 Tax=Legionella busanensis TaxID=190655 RepID=A0A378JLY9_9GAMM|nr:fatty acyl-AMP ligase [Legionella busanensis]STX52097.1 Uncharacterised protein [Legionella busanensis]